MLTKTTASPQKQIWVVDESNKRGLGAAERSSRKRDGAHIVALRLPFVANTRLCPYGDITETSSPSCRIIPPVPSSCLWRRRGLPSVIVRRRAGEPRFVPRVSILCAGGYGGGRETIGQNGPNVLKESSFFNRELTHMHHKGKTAQNPILRPPLHRDSFPSLLGSGDAPSLCTCGNRDHVGFVSVASLFFFPLFLFFFLLSLLNFIFSLSLDCHCRFTLPHLSLSLTRKERDNNRD